MPMTHSYTGLFTASDLQLRHLSRSCTQSWRASFIGHTAAYNQDNEVFPADRQVLGVTVFLIRERTDDATALSAIKIKHHVSQIGRAAPSKISPQK